MMFCISELEISPFFCRRLQMWICKKTNQPNNLPKIPPRKVSLARERGRLDNSFVEFVKNSFCHRLKSFLAFSFLLPSLPEQVVGKHGTAVAKGVSLKRNKSFLSAVAMYQANGQYHLYKHWCPSGVGTAECQPRTAQPSSSPGARYFLGGITY